MRGVHYIYLESSVPISCILAKKEEGMEKAVTVAKPEEHHRGGKEHSNSLCIADISPIMNTE
jgi:hypothetical protein